MCKDLVCHVLFRRRPIENHPICFLVRRSLLSHTLSLDTVSGGRAQTWEQILEAESLARGPLGDRDRNVSRP